MGDVIRSVDDEVIDETEDERAAHAGSHDQPPSRGRQRQTPRPTSGAGQDDDVDEQRAGGRERDLRAGVGAAVHDVDREVHQDHRG